MPWRMPAASIASPGLAENPRPLGCTVIWNAVAASVAVVAVASGVLMLLGILVRFSSRVFAFRRPIPLDAPSGRQPQILPSNQTPLGALPSRFRRERVLIIGCGDVGQRVA